MPEHIMQALYSYGQFCALASIPAMVLINLIKQKKIKTVSVGGCHLIPYCELERAMTEGI